VKAGAWCVDFYIKLHSLVFSSYILDKLVSYGKYDHEDWCTHKSSLRTWNLNKRLVTSEKPDAVVELSSCLMTISFHPQEPALIAGANFNGEFICCA